MRLGLAFNALDSQEDTIGVSRTKKHQYEYVVKLGDIDTPTNPAVTIGKIIPRQRAGSTAQTSHFVLTQEEIIAHNYLVPDAVRALSSRPSQFEDLRKGKGIFTKANTTPKKIISLLELFDANMEPSTVDQVSQKILVWSTAKPHPHSFSENFIRELGQFSQQGTISGLEPVVANVAVPLPGAPLVPGVSAQALDQSAIPPAPVVANVAVPPPGAPLVPGVSAQALDQSAIPPAPVVANAVLFQRQEHRARGVDDDESALEYIRYLFSDEEAQNHEDAEQNIGIDNDDGLSWNWALPTNSRGFSRILAFTKNVLEFSYSRMFSELQCWTVTNTLAPECGGISGINIDGHITVPQPYGDIRFDEGDLLGNTASWFTMSLLCPMGEIANTIPPLVPDANGITAHRATPEELASAPRCINKKFIPPAVNRDGSTTIDTVCNACAGSGQNRNGNAPLELVCAECNYFKLLYPSYTVKAAAPGAAAAAPDAVPVPAEPATPIFKSLGGHSTSRHSVKAKKSHGKRLSNKEVGRFLRFMKSARKGTASN
jgi:hypothetical protein